MGRRDDGNALPVCFWQIAKPIGGIGMNNADHNPYQSPRAIAPPDDVRKPKATLQERRRWRRGVCFGILGAAAVATCMSLWLDSELLSLGLGLAALTIPPIVAYCLFLAARGRRGIADAVFAFWTTGWTLQFAYIWLNQQLEPTGDSGMVGPLSLWMAVLLLTSHLAAYAGLRIGLGRKPNQDVS